MKLEGNILVDENENAYGIVSYTDEGVILELNDVPLTSEQLLELARILETMSSKI